MDILIDNTSKTPIYEQIVNQIKESIMNGTLNEGDALPSMRQLAKDLKVSVITTKRAYEELENDGFTYSVVGKGSFVKEQNIEQIRERKLKMLEEMIEDVIQNSKSMNLSKDELFELINILYEECFLANILIWILLFGTNNIHLLTGMVYFFICKF